MNEKRNKTTETRMLPKEKENIIFDDLYEAEHAKESMACVEVFGKRTACQKVFENADHSFTAALYPQAVHYQEDGVWKDIDNTLEEEETPEDVEEADAAIKETAKTMLFSTSETEEGEEKGWKKKAGALQVKLFHHTKENRTIRIRKGNAVLEWGLKGAAKVKGVLEKKETNVKEEKNPMVLKHFVSGVRYEEVFPDTDFQCLLVGENVKDNVILKSANASSMFTFLYRTKHCCPVLQDQSVQFWDEKGEVAFQVDAPFMCDAKGAVSEALTLELREGQKKDQWEIVVHADEAWLADEKRVYPVVLDPTTISPVDLDKVHANVVSAKNANLVNKQNTFLVLGGRTDVRRAFIKFTLPTMEPGDMVINAQMAIVDNTNDNEIRRLHLHRVMQDWESDHTCWYNKPVYEERILDTYQYKADTTKFVTFGITDLVKDWYENGKNYGVMLKTGHETKEMETILLGPGTHIGISDLRPQILVTYVSYSGLESYWTYHSQSVGRAGTVHINDYNGNMVYVHPVLSMSGNRMPVNVSLVYNNTYYKESIGYGLGFRLNYHQTIEKVTIGENDYYRHIDGDGTVHYFYENKTKEKWMDEANSELTLELGATDEAAYTIKDKNNGRLIFRKAGHLVQIKDRNNNTLKITWENNKITKLEDGAGRITTLAYNTDGLLSSVTDPVARVKSFAYDTKKQLTTITDVDGEVMTISYATIVGLINGVKNIDDYQVRYAYSGGNPRRIRRVCEYAGTERGNALNMVYGNNKTRFTDDRGKMECYFFNNSGNTVSVRDDKGYAMARKFNTDGNQVNRLNNQTKMQLVSAQLLQDPCGKTGIGSIWKGSVNTSTVTVSANTDPAQAKTGDRCLKMVSTESMGVGRCYQTLSIPAGRSFTFSAYVKMDVTELGSVGGCYLSLYYTDKDGNLQTVNNKRIETTGGGWKLISLPFSLPSDVSSSTVTCNIVLRNLKGSIYIDDLQVEWGLNPNRHNFVSNGDLTYHNLNLFTKVDSDDEDKIVTTGTETESPVSGLAKVGKAMASVYKGPGTTYEKLIDVWNGNPVEILNWVNGKDGSIWYRVRTQWEDTDELSNTGYIHGDDIEFFLAGGDGVRMGTLVHDGITVYVGPGSEYTVEAVPPKDTQMVIKDAAFDTSGKEWYHVRFQYDANWYGGYVPASEVAENCTNAASVKATVQTSVYYYPDTNYGVVRILEAEKTVPIRGTYTDSIGTEWYLIPAFQTTSNGYLIATMGYAKASSFTAVTEPSFALNNKEIVADGNGNLNGRVYKIVGDPIRDKKLTQTLEISGKKGDCYMVNAWGRGKTLSLIRTYRKFGVEVSFLSADGTREDHVSNFGADTTDWQYLSDAVVAKADYEKIEVSYVYCHNVNVAYFDGLSLYKEQYGASFTYDDDGNVISITDADGKSRKFEYDANENLIEITDVKGKKFKYDYDSKHNITKATTAANKVYNFTYDDCGNLTEQKTTDPNDSTSYMKVSKTYTSDKNYPLKVTDTLGNTSTYEWMTQRGVLNSMTDPRGNQTLYRYDNMKRLTAVSKKVKTIDGTEMTVRNAYTFTKDQMTSILHNGFTYGFTYDGFGNLEKADVAGTALVQYEREERNGKLLKTIYGNGQSLRYVYDSLDRIQTTYFKKNETASEQKCCSYSYDKQNNLSKVINYLSGKTYILSYDLLDRLCEVVDESGNSYEYTYDENNNLVKMYRTVGNSYVSESYAYDDDGREVQTSLRGFTRSTTYDALGRISKQSWNTPAFTTSYTYASSSNGSKSSMIQTMKNGNDTLSYTYDANGNITKITDTTGSTTYVYDELDQLIRENNHTLNKTITYLYDIGGNLVSRKEYAYTTAATLPTIPQKEDTYSYDSKWKDKLIGINGKTLTYDAIGNLTSYDGTTYSWSMGRQLEGIENGKSIQYAYNHAGMRVKKVVDGVTTEYHLAGSLIVGETTNGSNIWYNYDSKSNLISIIYNHVDYFYVKNGQGDIIALIDKEGNKVVEYKYNSWGAIESITGSMSATLGKKNPFRYRGYYYDEETELYYLIDRYYSARIHRFIHGDGYLNTGQGVNGTNTYIYCGNNPINRIDSNGHFWEILGSAAEGAIGGAVPGVGIVLVLIALYGVWQTQQNLPEISIPKIEEKKEEIAIPIPAPQQNHQEYFPKSPYDFHPNGLVCIEIVPIKTGRNGGIMHWRIPGTTAPIFEWDEDYRIGPHYHVMLPEWRGKHLEGGHYRAGDPIPEPWNTIYFGNTEG